MILLIMFDGAFNRGWTMYETLDPNLALLALLFSVLAPVAMFVRGRRDPSMGVPSAASLLILFLAPLVYVWSSPLVKTGDWTRGVSLVLTLVVPALLLPLAGSVSLRTKPATPLTVGLGACAMLALAMFVYWGLYADQGRVDFYIGHRRKPAHSAHTAVALALPWLGGVLARRSRMSG